MEIIFTIHNIRWGSGGIAGYKTNCRDLLSHVKKHMSAKTQVIHSTPSYWPIQKLLFFMLTNQKPLKHSR